MIKNFKSKILMKKYIIALLVCWVAVSTAQAQLSENRTTATKIADLLATQPADHQERLEHAMLQLEQFSASDLVALISQLQRSGSTQNVPIKYALQSYSFHLSLTQNVQKITVFNNGILAGLEQVKDPAVKRFLLQTLQYTGNDQIIPQLFPYLQQPDYYQTVASVLSKIGTNAAANVLLQALKASQADVAQTAFINNLGQLQFAPAEKTIQDLYEAKQSTAKNKALLKALAQIAGKDSEKLLSDAAKYANYKYDEMGATEALLEYAHNRLVKGDVPTALKIGKMVHDAKSVSPAVKAAALTLLVEADGAKELVILVQAAKSKDPAYRETALKLMAEFDDKIATADLVKDWNKQAEAVKISQLYYFGKVKHETGLSVVKTALAQSNDAIVAAAVNAWHEAKGNEGVKEILPLLVRDNELTRKAVRQVLLSSSHPQLSEFLINHLKEEKDSQSQINTLYIIGERHFENARHIVLDQIRSNPQEGVRNAAYHALSNIALADQFDELLKLFDANVEVSNDPTKIVPQQTNRNGVWPNVRYISNAVIRAVKYSDQQSIYAERLSAHYHQSSVQVKNALLGVFAAIGDEKLLAIAVAESQVGSPSALLSSAISSLAQWSNELAIPHLIRIQRQLNQYGTNIPNTTGGDVAKGIIRLVGKASFPDAQKTILLRDLFERVTDVELKKQILRGLEATRTYNALRFAGQYLDDEQLKSVAANTVMTIALDNPTYHGQEVVQLLEKVYGILSGSESSYLREAIHKHIASLPSDGGFVSLFNGRDLTGWKGLVANPIKRAAMDASTLATEQQKADELMREGWYVEGGVLHFNGKGDNIATTKAYRNFEMYVDWKLAADGKDGDAGIYLRGTPQVQIWDTSRVNVGAQVGSGGLYNNQIHPSKPLLVADNPLGEWNTFRIIMIDDRVTVYLNGHLVTDNVVLENYWDRSKPIFPMEQIELQAHGTHVSYRDIYIKELPDNAPFELNEEEKAEGFEVLFDGTHMDHWTGNTKDYVVTAEKTLAVFPKEGSGGNLYTKEEYGDFVFRFSFRLTPGANNGIGIRAPLEGDAAYVGMEIQVLDDTADIYKNLKEWQYHGSVYGIIPAKRGHLKPVGEWNEEEIYIKGDYIRVTLNGVVTVEGNLKEATKSGTLDGKDHPGLNRTSGHIGFLGHGSEVHFKNIRIKKL